MAEKAVARRGVSIALACRAFGVSETCYRNSPKLKDENEEIADLLVGLTEARKTSHACVSLPTCGLGLAESERAFGGVMDKIDAVLRELKLEKEPILIRMTGCPNGCSRPYNADLSFVGRAPGKYAFYAGGSHRGDRLAGLEKKVVTEEEIPSVVRAHLEPFAKERRPGESFSDFWGRTRGTGAAPHPSQFHEEFAERAAKGAG